MGDEILIGRTHVSEQDMQNALRAAFLEGFKEGTSISQKSMFAATFLENYLRESSDGNKRNELGYQACWDMAEMFVGLGRKKKPDANPTTGH
jgi:hypothetical protein